MASDYKGKTCFSKKRYHEIETKIEAKYATDMASDIMSIIRDVLKFDPETSTYDEDNARKIKEYRAKKKAEGISTYISSGMKASYEKRKKEKGT